MQSLTTLLQKLEEISEKATPEKWSFSRIFKKSERFGGGYCASLYFSADKLSSSGSIIDEENAEAIVAWRSCIKELVAVAKASCRRKHARHDDSCEVLEAIGGQCGCGQFELLSALSVLTATLESALK